MKYRVTLLITIFALLCSISTFAGTELEQWIEQAGSVSVADINNICDGICKQGEATIIELCKHIKPSGDDSNVRLLVRGLVNYASTQPIEVQDMTSTALSKALKSAQDKQIKAFLISELQMLGNPGSVEAIAEYLGDKDLCDYAIRALQTINSDLSFQKLTEQLARSEGRCQQGLILALAGMGRAEAIAPLEGLLNSSTPELRNIILIALSQLETDSDKFFSLLQPELSSDNPQLRYQGYSLLFTQLERSIKQNGVNPQQKAILDNLFQKTTKENNTWAMCSVLHLFTYLPPSEVLDLFAREMYNPAADVCAVALGYLVKVNSAESKNLLKEALVKSSPENLYQVLDAIARIPNDSFIPAIVPILNNPDEKTRIKAIQTLVKVNAQKAVPILVKRLIEAQEISDCNAIKHALLQTPPDETVSELGKNLKKLEGDKLVIALDIFGQRQATQYFSYAYKQTKNKDPKVENMALSVLGMLGTKNDVPLLMKQMLKPKANNQNDFSEIISQILKREEGEDRCKPIISAIEKAKPEQYPLLMPILAKVGDDEARAFILSWLNLPAEVEQNKPKIESAVSALTIWENPELSENLVEFLSSHPEHPYRNDIWKALVRFLSLPGLASYEKVFICQQCIQLMPENAGDMFNILGGIQTIESFVAVAKYSNNPQFSELANKTLVRIALPGKNNDTGLLGEDIIPYLENALKVIEDNTQKESIQKHIEKCRKSPKILPIAYEDDIQFVPLFNGKDLTGWTGYTRGFVARFGKLVCLPICHLNLYTEKQYKDFILRFDFKLSPGANNGIGLRTPTMKDAAYHGMEIQILDDNAPENLGMKPYQHHGAIYGVLAPAIPAPLKKCGEWNQEEIILQGSNISVRVNGVEILTAYLKELASKPTPDGKEHPGLLNESGHIGLLGHGSQVEFRNMRIKTLL